MDFNFTEEQTMIRDSLARLIREQYDFETRMSVVNSDSGWRPEMWAQFAELGLLMAPFSEVKVHGVVLPSILVRSYVHYTGTSCDQVSNHPR